MVYFRNNQAANSPIICRQPITFWTITWLRLVYWKRRLRIKKGVKSWKWEWWSGNLNICVLIIRSAEIVRIVALRVEKIKLCKAFFFIFHKPLYIYICSFYCDHSWNKLKKMPINLRQLCFKEVSEKKSK